MAMVIYPLKNQIVLHNPVSYAGPELHLKEAVSSNLVMQVAATFANQVKQINLGIFSSDRKIDLNVFRTFITSCVNCEVVDFSYCEGLDDKAISTIADICKENTDTKVQEFVLRSLPLITEQDLLALNQVPSLKKVTLQQNVRIIKISNPSQFNFKVELLPTAGYDG